MILQTFNAWTMKQQPFLLPFALWMCAVGVLAGCDSTTDNDTENLVVVEAFLYAGEPVDDIQLASTIPFGSSDTVGVPINDASVQLIRDGVTYTLASSGTDGRYAYIGEDLHVKAADVFTLDIAYDGQHITAQTTVPPPPDNVQLSDDALLVPDLENDGFGSFGDLRDFFSVTWDNPSNEYHYVVIQSEATDNPDYILPDFVRDFIGDFELVTEPTTTNFYDILPLELEFIGQHEATVYRINTEYAELFENLEQDSRDLNEPPTNIEGGLGIFSAFNSVTIPFDVVRD